MTWGDPARRLAAAFAACLLLPLAGVGTPVHAVARDGADVDPDPGVVARLDHDIGRPSPQSGERTGRRWPGRQIPYSETLPAAYDWSLKHALSAWNKSGIGTKFVKVAATKSKLKISVGETYGATGFASIGYQGTNYVHMVPPGKGPLPAAEKEIMGRVIAHELGHVLGLEHNNSQRCALMSPVIYQDCAGLSATKPGYYHCRWITKADGSKASALYGGSFHLAPRYCLVYPLPPQLGGVVFSGGAAADKPVKIAWTLPRHIPAGSRIQVWTEPGSTCAFTGAITQASLAATATSWTEKNQRKGTSCYRLRIVNSLGAGPRAFTDVRQRWAPAPDPPSLTSVTALVTDDNVPSYRITGSIPAGASLYYQFGTSPGDCSTAWPGMTKADSLFRQTDGSWLLLAPDYATHCASFFVVNRWNNASSGVVRTLSYPTPAGPTISSVTPQDVGWPEYRITGSIPADSDLVAAVGAPGTCPTTWSDSLNWYYLTTDGPGAWLLDVDDFEAHCVSFFVMAWTGPPSAGVVRSLAFPPVSPPTISTVGAIDADTGARQVTGSIPDGTTLLALVRPSGQCVATWPAAEDPWSWALWDEGGTWSLYSAPDGSCVSFFTWTTSGRFSTGVARQLP